MTRSWSFRRALVVDDCPVIRKVHSKILERLHFDVISVNDGQQALNACAENQFDVVLMDCEMPVMDGLTATIAWRTIERSKPTQTTIIGVTSSGKRDCCTAAGMNAFLIKPLHIDSLAMVLCSLLPKVCLFGCCRDERLEAVS